MVEGAEGAAEAGMRHKNKGNRNQNLDQSEPALPRRIPHRYTAYYIKLCLDNYHFIHCSITAYSLKGETQSRREAERVKALLLYSQVEA